MFKRRSFAVFFLASIAIYIRWGNMGHANAQVHRVTEDFQICGLVASGMSVKTGKMVELSCEMTISGFGIKTWILFSLFIYPKVVEIHSYSFNRLILKKKFEIPLHGSQQILVDELITCIAKLPRREIRH